MCIGEWEMVRVERGRVGVYQRMRYAVVMIDVEARGNETYALFEKWMVKKDFGFLFL